MKNYIEIHRNSGEWEEKRKTQTSKWMWSLVEEGLLINFNNNSKLKNKIPEFEKAVNNGKMLPTTAAKQMLNLANSKNIRKK